jgi:hypothetical protein
MLLTPAASSVFPPFERRLDNSRAETFPGAACYTTAGNATIFRAVTPGDSQRSKAAPLQAPVDPASLHRRFALPHLAREFPARVHYFR